MKPSTVNKTVGNRFEQELCDLLAANGFWAHNMAQNHDGQPADVIACINDTPFLIDCKVCANDTFPVSRIEDNQHTAMQLFEAKDNSCAYFALKLSNGDIYMHHYEGLKYFEEHGGKTLTRQQIIDGGDKFEDWVESVIDDVYNDRLQDYDN
ncbi:MAG: Holliday junction resolvase RecU [Alloprevotella sp.]|nr:Holliday junction resolvase RecU [Alloprevotella sp.]